MEAPICAICLKSDMLCLGCEEKLRKGEITQLDVDVARAIYKLSEKYKPLEKIRFRGTMSADDLVVIFVERGDLPLLVGKGGRVSRELSQILGKKIRVVEKTNNFKELVANLIAPASLLGINIVYSPNGGTYYKIRVDKRTAWRLPMPIVSLEALLRKLADKDVKVVLE